MFPAIDSCLACFAIPGMRVTSRRRPKDLPGIVPDLDPDAKTGSSGHGVGPDEGRLSSVRFFCTDPRTNMILVISGHKLTQVRAGILSGSHIGGLVIVWCS